MIEAGEKKSNGRAEVECCASSESSRRAAGMTCLLAQTGELRRVLHPHPRCRASKQRKDGWKETQTGDVSMPCKSNVFTPEAVALKLGCRNDCEVAHAVVGVCHWLVGHLISLLLSRACGRSSVRVPHTPPRCDSSCVGMAGVP